MVSDLISEDTFISKDGAVTGTLKYNEGVTAFEADEQNGNYFPLQLDKKYEGKEITVKRNGTERKKATDLEWVLYVPDNSVKFTFETAEDGVFLTLTFAEATLSKNAIKRTARRVRSTTSITSTTSTT